MVTAARVRRLRLPRRGWRWILVASATAVLLPTALLWSPSPRAIVFPDGKRFALTIVDDTDLATLERVKPLYDALHEAGLRTTKTVWSLPMADDGIDADHGDTLQDADYRDFVLDLKEKGFEIGLHGVRGGSSPREASIKGLEEFKSIVGHYPKVYINHAVNREDLYWGHHRLTVAPFRWALGALRPVHFSGHIPDSPYFWGDVAKERIKYVRRFVFDEINVLRKNAYIPYRLDQTPFVNYWFDSSDGGSIDTFERLLSPENLDRLERERGVCIIYAHLGAGSFNLQGGGANPRFLSRIRDVASRSGWFVPVSELLDYLATQQPPNPRLNFFRRIRLETSYVLDWIW